MAKSKDKGKKEKKKAKKQDWTNEVKGGKKAY